MLSDRRQLVLRALIEEYIDCALPVGSRRLVERYNLGISSATVRNELSLLEEMGYLAQPHTSAGRVPTDFGYRAFVDDLLSRGDIQADEETLSEFRACAGEVDELMERTSQALARFTDCMTLLVPPRVLSVSIRQINLILLSPRRLLVVIVTADGQVMDRHIELAEEATAEQVERTQQLLNDLLVGRSLSADAASMPFDAAEIDDELLGAVCADLMRSLKERTAIKAHLLGMSHLLGKPEFSDSSHLMPVLEELEGDTMLLRVFDDALHSSDPVVRIGHENDSAALERVSLIANRFGEEGRSGLIVIVGPTRMDYSHAFRAIRAAQDILKDL